MAASPANPSSEAAVASATGSSSTTTDAAALAKLADNRMQSSFACTPEANADPGLPTTTDELADFVEGMLEQMQSRFTSLGKSLNTRMEEMSGHMDELEKSMGELMGQPVVATPTAPPVAEQAPTLNSVQDDPTTASEPAVPQQEQPPPQQQPQQLQQPPRLPPHPNSSSNDAAKPESAGILTLSTNALEKKGNNKNKTNRRRRSRSRSPRTGGLIPRFKFQPLSPTMAEI